MTDHTEDGSIAPPFPSADDNSDSPIENPSPKGGKRRRRGKGKSAKKEAEAPTANEPSAEIPVNPAPESQPDNGKPEQTRPRKTSQEHPHKAQKPQRKLDPERLATNAWNIFLAEVSEEGVALLADNDARELARRCFRLSEIFLEEEDRRR